MQIDMHYYGTYAMARAAGLKPKDAQIIAYSAQFVDDSTHTDSNQNKDGGLLYAVATAHHSSQAVADTILHETRGQRRMWVPFHFYPGNMGNSLSKRLICQKDSPLVNEMFNNHINRSRENLPFILHLIGIASHVYIDTFSHYGFSGLSSRNNKADQSTFEFPEDKSKELNTHHKTFTKKNKKEFHRKNWRESVINKQSFLGRLADKYPTISGYISSLATQALGHGSVSTCPDLPFLEWSFTYEQSRQPSGKRDNPKTFLEGCEKLHEKLLKFSKLYYQHEQIKYRDFSEIKNAVKEILSYKSSVEKGYNERKDKWKEAAQSGKLFDNANQKEFLDYNEKDWRMQKDELFKQLQSSAEAVKLNVYKFHQAADYHRHYTLKELLPKHGLVVN